MNINHLRKEIRDVFKLDFAQKFLSTNAYAIPAMDTISYALTYSFTVPRRSRNHRFLKAIYLLEGLFPQRPKFLRIEVNLRFRDDFVIYVARCQPGSLAYYSLFRFLPRGTMRHKHFNRKNNFRLVRRFFPAGLMPGLRPFTWKPHLVIQRKFSPLMWLGHISFF